MWPDSSGSTKYRWRILTLDGRQMQVWTPPMPLTSCVTLSMTCNFLNFGFLLGKRNKWMIGTHLFFWTLGKLSDQLRKVVVPCYGLSWDLQWTQSHKRHCDAHWAGTPCLAESLKSVVEDIICGGQGDRKLSPLPRVCQLSCLLCWHPRSLPWTFPP